MASRKHANHAHNRPAPVSKHSADPNKGNTTPGGAGSPNQGTSVPKQSNNGTP